MKMEAYDHGIGIPAELLVDYLRSAAVEISDLHTVRKFGAGQSNPTYLLEASSGRYVLRLRPSGSLPPSAHRIDREFRVMKALAASAVPVPRVLHLSCDNALCGRSFYLMEYVEGRALADPALAHQDHDRQRKSAYRGMASTLAAIHEVDVEALGLTDFGRPGSYFRRQLERFSAQDPDASAGIVKLVNWLLENLPPEDGRHALIHGDFRMDNLIFSEDLKHVRGVLDWELSTLGHPFSDLTYQCLVWHLPAQPFNGLLHRTVAGDLPSESDYVAFYCQARGIAGIEHWRFHLAFAFYRYIAICRGLSMRAAAGNASDPERARQYGEAVPQLVDLATAITRGGTVPNHLEFS